jgi:hypothetical protein
MALVGSSTLISADVALAAGGGCELGGGNSGWRITSCISVSGENAYPDLYIDQVTTAGKPGDCWIQVGIQNQVNARVVDLFYASCRVGHYGPVSYRIDAGVKYRTHVRAFNMYPASSPWAWR